MKDWGAEFAKYFVGMYNCGCEFRKEMMIAENKMICCVNCRFFEEKKEGHYWTTGCLNPRTPLRLTPPEYGTAQTHLENGITSRNILAS